MHFFKLWTILIIIPTSLVSAHTWGDQISVIGINGIFTGEPGYPRGYKARSDPGFVEQDVLYQLPRPASKSNILPVNASFTEFTQNDYSDKYPMLKAKAGDWIAIRYQENGHVSLPQNQPNKPPNRGDIYVFWVYNATTLPTLSEMMKWTADGTGGNGKGKLIATRNYDDGRCHQTNGGAIDLQRTAKFPKKADSLQGADLWCQSDVQIPSDATTGGALAWMWNWPTLKPEFLAAHSNDTGFAWPLKGDGVAIPEIYTIVADINICGNSSDSTANSSTNAQSIASTNADASSNFFGTFAKANLEPDNIGNAAIQEQLQTQFMVKISGMANSTYPNATVSIPVNTTIIGPEFTRAPNYTMITITAPAVHVTSTVYQAQVTQHASTTCNGSAHKRRNRF